MDMSDAIIIFVILLFALLLHGEPDLLDAMIHYLMK